MATFEEALQAKEHLVKRWKKMPGVVGIGVGHTKGKDGKRGACVVLYTVSAVAAVQKRCPRCVSMKSSAIGTRVSVPVRTVVSGRCRCHPLVKSKAAGTYRRRIRPVVAGYSVGYPGISGTAGLIVSGAVRRAQRYLLSNNHVLNRNNSSDYTETIQPGGADGGRSGRDRIGRMYRYVRLQPNGVNYLDAAISIPTSNGLLVPLYATVGRVRGYVRSYAVGTRLKKVGRSSGLVSGTVESIHTDIEVDYGRNLGILRFRNQTIIRGSSPVSLAGDSGSVWLTNNNYAAAINFAGSADGLISISFPVQWAMQAFGITVAKAAKTTGAALSPRRKGEHTRPLSEAELRRIEVKTVRRAIRSAHKKRRRS